VLSVVESHDVTGGGPPPHIHHREDETFQILEGEYEWTVGGKTFLAQKGATLFAPRGVPHTYRYAGKTPGKLMCTITPSGFEEFFEEIGALSPQQQQDIPRVLEIGKKYGLEILPPPNA
jgi:mannose-6-phosphate isomerase-like protein (cupin superfamily)